MATIQEKFLEQLSNEDAASNNREKMGVIPRGGSKRSLKASDFDESPTLEKRKKVSTQKKKESNKKVRKDAPSKTVYKGKKIAQMKNKIF